MNPARRFLAAIAILGLAIALTVYLQRRGAGDAASTEAADAALLPMDGTVTGALESAAGRSGPVSATDTGDEAAAAGQEVATQCGQTINDAAEFASRERSPANPAEVPESISDRFAAELGKAQRSMAGSRDPEQFLAAYLLESQEGRAAVDPQAQTPYAQTAAAQTRLLELGDRATASGSKLLAWHALRACVEAMQSCPIAHLEQRLLDADRQNAEAWAAVATLRYQRGDTGGALTAMQGAARAPTSTWYTTETMALIERSLSAGTAMPFVERRSAAAITGWAFAYVPSPSSMCRAQSAASRAWSDACLAFGRLRGERNETMAARLIAYSIREEARAALGDREGALEEAAEQVAMRNANVREQASTTLLREALLDADPARWPAYLGAVQQFGELAGARTFLRQEVPSLLERAGLLNRDGARECVAQFFVAARQAPPSQQVQVADELHIAFRSASMERGQTTLRIRPDGKITLPFAPRTRATDGTTVRSVREIVAAGKTTGQLRSEIAAMLAGYYKSPDVFLTLLSPGSREELRREFDNAQREVAERRSSLR